MTRWAAEADAWVRHAPPASPVDEGLLLAATRLSEVLFFGLDGASEDAVIAAGYLRRWRHQLETTHGVTSGRVELRVDGSLVSALLLVSGQLLSRRFLTDAVTGVRTARLAEAHLRECWRSSVEVR